MQEVIQLQMAAKKVLIIDDEDRIREVVQACLEDLVGWETSAAASGYEGLHRAESEPFDAILLDISMPDMDGFTVFSQLQGNPTTKKIPVILLTAKVLPEDTARFAQMGVAGVITKPFSILQLAQQLTHMLGWH